MNLYDNNIYIEMHEGIRPGGLALTEHLIKLSGLNNGELIIDVGCGSGISLDLINRKYQLKTVGIDSSNVLLSAGLKNCNSLRLILGDGKDLPFRDGSIDGALAECSLSVMEDPFKVLSEIYRVLSDKGKLAISDVYLREPEYAAGIRNLPLTGCISGAFIYHDLITMLDDSGFNLILWEDHSNLWKEFVARILLNNDSCCGFFSSGISEESGSSGLFSTAVMKSKPGYFCLIAEKR